MLDGLEIWCSEKYFIDLPNYLIYMVTLLTIIFPWIFIDFKCLCHLFIIISPEGRDRQQLDYPPLFYTEMEFQFTTQQPVVYLIYLWF